MITLEEIKNLFAQHREELKDKFKVKEIGVFGSFARGEKNEKSDIDVLVEFGGPVSLLKLAGLENRLEEIMGIEVDVVPREDVRPELKETILKEVVYL